MKVIAVVALLTLSVSVPLCLGQGLSSNPTGCLNPAEVLTDVDYFPDKVEAVASEFWDITYFDTYKVVRNEFEDTIYLLYQCGTEPPADAMSSGTYDAVIPVPLQDGVAVTQTTMIPHIEILGLRDQIRGYVGSPGFISSPCLNQLVEDGTVVVVSNSSDPIEVAELLASAGDDLVAFRSEFDEIVEIENQVVISEFRETTNAGTYEWNKFYSAFYNLEGLANELYVDVTDRYDCISENADFVETDAGMEEPVVLWAYYSTFSNNWDVAECPNFFCEFSEICSANLLNTREGSGGVQGEVNRLLTLEEFVEFGKDAEYWIFNSGNWDNIYAENKEALDQFKSVQNQQVFDYQGVSQNSWFEQRLVEFDVVAQDFCAVVGTQPQDPFHQRVYFRNVFTEEIGTEGQCTDASAPLETRSTPCTPLAVTPPQTPAPTDPPSTSTAATAGTLLSVTVMAVALAVMQ